jgi:hypothetical protein
MKIKMLTSVILAILSLFFGASASQALDYSEGTITGKLPTAEGCDQDATTKKSIYLKDKWGSNVAFLELRYSINCHAAWARITNYYNYVPYDQHSATAWVVRDTDGKTYACSPPAGTFKSCYTKMVFDLDPRTAHAEAELDPYPDYYSPWISGRTASY